jgi:hypothetical protein
MQPGARDVGFPADGVEADPLAAAVHAPSGGDGAVADLICRASGCLDDVVRVVSSQRRPL